MATLTLPSITISSAPSTSIVATPVTGLVAPVASGTVLYNCSVLPAGWVGAIALTGTPADMVVANLSGNTFQIVVGATALGAGTYSGGTITATP